MKLRLVEDTAGIEEFVQALPFVDIVGLDVESSGLDPFNDRWLLMQVSIGETVFVFDIVGLKNHMTFVAQALLDSDALCVGHNIKFDIKVIKANTGVGIENVFDTMIGDGVANTGLGRPFVSLQSLLFKHLDIVMEKDVREDFIGATIVTQEMYLYAAKDVLNLVDLYESICVELEEKNLTKTADLEMELLPQVAWMELEGVSVNQKLWKEITASAIERQKVWEEKLKDTLINPALDKLLVGDADALTVVDKLKLQVKLKRDRDPMEGITDRKTVAGIVREWLNLNSPAQFKEILTYSKVYVPSANKKELARFKHHEVIRDYLEFKPYSKRINSYGEDFLDKINPKTGRLHAQFNQLGTVSGRWSCEKPNLQQIPGENEDDPEARYRECFEASKDHLLLTVDFNQAELRLLGAVANERAFIDAYNNELDIHVLTASNIYGVEYDIVTKEQRSRGKSINFAIVYGSTAYGLEYNFGIPQYEGEAHLEAYFAAYPYIAKFIELAGEKIWELGYSITPFGRKRYFDIPEIFEDGDEKAKIKASVLRRGINTIIQGGSADILKIALVDIYHRNPFGDLFKLLLTVHDEGVWEVHESIAEEAEAFVVATMEEAEQVFLKDIPAKADSMLSKTWRH